MRDRILGLGIIGVAFGLGAVAGHVWTKRRLEVVYYGKLDAEMEAARKYYAKLQKRDEYDSPTNLVDESDEEDRPIPEDKSWQEDLFEEVNESEEEFRARVARDRQGRELQEHEGKRDPKVAYVISYEEFFENPKDYDQRTLTYFSKDDVVVEERDQPIEDVLAVLGPNALDQFGNGSKDPNIVYVRNDYLTMDFEVCYDPDSFEETVVGHIKHGQSRKTPHFRVYDD